MKPTQKAPEGASNHILLDNNADEKHLKDLFNEAKRHLNQNRPIVPMGANRKQGNYKLPLIRWKEDGPITTVEKLDSTFKQLGNNIFGIATVVEGYILADFDYRDTRKNFDDLPITVTIKTGKGQHMWFATSQDIKHNGPVKLGSNSLHKKDQLEIYTSNRLEILPPSLHHSGAKYEWSVDIDEVEILPSLPKSIRRLLDITKPSSGSKFESERVVYEGERHSQLIKAVSHFSQLAKGEQGKVSRLVKGWNEHCCHPPLGQSEVNGAIEWAVTTYKGTGQKESKNDKLLNSIITDPSIVIFRDQNMEGYANITTDGSRFNLALNSQDFANYARYKLYHESGQSISDQQLREVTSLLNAKARFEAEEHYLFHRVAKIDDVIVYDLANDKGEIVKITSKGWMITDSNEFPFVFKKGAAKAQVTPKNGGDLRQMLELVNIKDTESQILYLSTLPVRLIRDVDQMLAYIFGPAGSAKTTLLKMTKDLLDPSLSGISAPVDNINDAKVLLNQTWVFANDNISHISRKLSDFFCLMATGAEDSRRKLYTDSDVTVFNIKNPAYLTGINVEAYASDLMSRIILFKTEMIDSESRVSGTELKTQYEEIKPYLLGAVFDTLTKAMKIREDSIIKSGHRMADFVMWGAACSEALGYGAERFMKAFDHSVKERAYDAIYSTAVGRALLKYLDIHNSYEGTITELLRRLRKINWGEDNENDYESVAKNASALGKRLRAIENSLAEVGIRVDFGQRTSSDRIIKVYREDGDVF